MNENIGVGVIISQKLFVEMSELDDSVRNPFFGFFPQPIGLRTRARDQKPKIFFLVFRQKRHYFRQKLDIFLGRDPSRVKQNNRRVGNAGAFSHLSFYRIGAAARIKNLVVDAARTDENAFLYRNLRRIEKSPAENPSIFRAYYCAPSPAR